MEREPDIVCVTRSPGRDAGASPRRPPAARQGWRPGGGSRKDAAGSDGRRGYIYHAGVRPEFRGRGIGTALVEAALEKLRALGITKVGLLVFRNNDAGSRFWEARGFAAREDLAYRSCVLREMTRIQ